MMPTKISLLLNSYQRIKLAFLHVIKEYASAHACTTPRHTRTSRLTTHSIKNYRRRGGGMTIEDVDSVEIQHVTHNGINYTITKNAALLIAQSNTHSTSWTPKTVHHAERQSSHPFAVLLEGINTANIKQQQQQQQQ